MGLSFTILASGSTGNATVVSTDAATVLVDAGLSGKKLEELMKERDIAAADLDAVFVTHEHSDHIRGLGALARKYALPVYASEGTWAAMRRSVGDIPDAQRRILPAGGTTEIGDLRVESYAISHDAAEPVGFSFLADGAKLSLATDLGYVSDKVARQLRDSDVLVLEANHDVNMLRMGRYPWNIKRRILGDTGHLSNDAAGEALCRLLVGDIRRVYLAHLSQEHNLMDLAKLTVNTILEDNGFTYRPGEFAVCETYPDRPTPWDRVKEAAPVAAPADRAAEK
jgi:phosphoribosyl 1,2-cyclic phosphodiesterase